MIMDYMENFKIFSWFFPRELLKQKIKSNLLRFPKVEVVYIDLLSSKYIKCYLLSKNSKRIYIKYICKCIGNK